MKLIKINCVIMTRERENVLINNEFSVIGDNK